MISVREIVQERKYIKVSAPCRIDAGGTWDIKAMALPFEEISPTTVNIALSLRTYVKISPFDENYVKISSKGFDTKIFPISDLSFDPPYGLFLAAVRHFGFHGLEININSTSPIQSGLGGSSTALVALIKALSEIKKEIDGKDLSKEEILYLSYHIEDGISGGSCGAQDQAAAIYGGINKWIWKYSKPYICERSSLLDERAQKMLSERILVLYTGKRHLSSDTNKGWIRDFLSGKTQKGWIEANEIVHKFADAIKEMNIEKAVELLNKEMEIRREITPDAFIPLTERLIDQAKEMGCAARFAGAGAGGSVWAIGERENIERLGYIWQRTVSEIEEARILECTIDPEGLIVYEA